MVSLPGLGGHTQQGTRPAIIVAAPKLPVVTIIPCTSNLQALRFPHTIRVESSKRNGLTVPSVVLAFQLIAIDRRFFQKKLGTLERPLIGQINTELRSLLSL